MTDRPDTLAQTIGDLEAWLRSWKARTARTERFHRWAEAIAERERLLEQRTREIEEERVILAAAVVRMRELETALRQYADARHWGICRDDLRYRVVSWIGPGADEKPVPNPVKIAREALHE